MPRADVAPRRGRWRAWLRQWSAGDLSSLLPLFACIAAALALIAAVLPLVDRP